jgi:hypothetical protein
MGQVSRSAQGCARICAAEARQRDDKRMNPGEFRRPPRGLRASPHNPCTPDTFGIQAAPLPARSITDRQETLNDPRVERVRSRPISRVLSRAIIHLRYASPRTSSDLPGSTCGPHARPHPRMKPPAPLFGLAPGGVCRAAECCHRRGALLPHHFTLTAPLQGVGGLLSVALSVGSRPPGVTWRRALGARTFLHACAQRLPGRLRRRWWGRSTPEARCRERKTGETQRCSIFRRRAQQGRLMLRC